MSHSEYTHAQWRAIWLSIPGIGPATIRQLEKKNRDVVAATLLAAAWQNPSKNVKKILTLEQTQAVHNWKNVHSIDELLGTWNEQGIVLINDSDKQYSQLLNSCADRPLVLFAKGNTNLLNQKSLSLVGTRQPTVYGLVATRLLVRELVARNWVSVSGMMIGIDGEVHRSTLAAKGSTIGVLGYGLGRCFPRSQERLLQAVIDEGGCLISEYAPGTPAVRHQFVQRNRIIAGLSPATIVVEAATQSGTMITVERALDYGRVVGAVPGPITSQYSQGTATLLSQGAVCVSSLQAIWDELGEEQSPSTTMTSQEEVLSSRENELSDSAALAVWNLLKTTAQTVDSLVSETKLPVSKVLTYLEKWQLEGFLVHNQGSYMVVRPGLHGVS